MRQILTLKIMIKSAMAVGALALVAACGSAAGESADSPLPQIVVTTNILGDVVEQLVGDTADVEVLMPIGADPHSFALSARQAVAMEEADLVVVNGENFEQGMTGVIESVMGSGTPVFVATDHVELLEPDEADHDHDDEEADHDHDDEEADHDDEAEHDHDDEEADHDDEEADHDHDGEAEHDHDDEEADHDHDAGHDHGDHDPHIWTDPERMIDVAEALSVVLSELEGIDTDALRISSDTYLAELAGLAAEIETMLAAIPDERRVIVTNHEVFGYFADRYGFEVAGAVVPSLTTNAETSAREIEDLAALLKSEGIQAIFAETTQSTSLAESLADASGSEVQVIELYTESLGAADSPASTYIDMMRFDARTITDALGD